jgi:aminoglycoside phosphotransferase (APT) family kinase protein
MTGKIDRQAEFSGTRDVREAHRFDEAALDAYLRDHVAGYNGPLTVEQFKGGQSNPTYKLTTPDSAYVLRRKPPGKLLPSAHAVDREYKVIAAFTSSACRCHGLTSCARMTASSARRST